MSNKKSKKSKQKDMPANDDGNITDKRFQIAQTHPQFQKRHTKRNNQYSNKTVGGDGEGDNKDIDLEGNLLLGNGGGSNFDEQHIVDDRFKAVLTDSRFAIGGDIGVKEGGVDKYGRKLKHKKKKKKDTGEDIDKDVNDEDSVSNHVESNDEDEERTDGIKSKAVNNALLNQDPESRIAYLTALSRGEIDCSSTDDDTSSDEEENPSDDDESSTGSEDSLYGTAGVLDPSNKQEEEIELTYDKSKYMAVCNMDWMNVRAVDLLAVISSFSPPGSVKFVHVYPSDFGLERMEKDSLFGPVGVWKKEKKSVQLQDPERDGGNDADDNEEKSDKSESENQRDDSTDEEGELEYSDKSPSEDEQSDNEEDGELDDFDIDKYQHYRVNEDKADSDFDAEKLRAYEAAKLKYYFAVVEFSSYEAADIAYKELDGMEMGHSSSNIDFRSIPESDIGDVIKGRECRDKASVLPSNYNPPDFVVSALQQTAVKCTWEEGDKERERLLTQYGVGNEAWKAMADGDDLKAYLASDASSDDEDSSDDECERKKKGSNMRQLLGLDNSDDDSFGKMQDTDKNDNDSVDSFFGGVEGEDNDEDDDNDNEKTFTYIPGKKGLEEKIRNKIKDKEENQIQKELTPWEKYQQKRKEKRKMKKKKAKESKLIAQEKITSDMVDDDDDDFQVNDRSRPSTKEELDLLLAGDDDEEGAKDYHMRDLIRIDKNKSKKLKGSRKRKEQDIASSAPGLDFKVDTSDNRFAAVLEGDDDRFGIDTTHPNYKETPAMREILAEQTKRRKEKGHKRRKKDVVADVSADAVGKSSGALALSSLVKSLQSKVAQK